MFLKPNNNFADIRNHENLFVQCNLIVLGIEAPCELLSPSFSLNRASEHLWLAMTAIVFACVKIQLPSGWLITQSAPPMSMSVWCVIWKRQHKVFLRWASGWGTDAQWSMWTAVIKLVPWRQVTAAVTVARLHTSPTFPAGCCDLVMVQSVTVTTHSYFKLIWFWFV